MLSWSVRVKFGGTETFYTQYAWFISREIKINSLELVWPRNHFCGENSFVSTGMKNI
jgi:hypothetical protein